jgi:hypothetical protein
MQRDIAHKLLALSRDLDILLFFCFCSPITFQFDLASLHVVVRTRRYQTLHIIFCIRARTVRRRVVNRNKECGVKVVKCVRGDGSPTVDGCRD